MWGWGHYASPILHWATLSSPATPAATERAADARAARPKADPCPPPTMGIDGRQEAHRVREEAVVRQDPRASRAQELEADRRQPLRGPRAPRAAVALGPAVGARRGPCLVGAAKGG